jgi:two-component system response regulator AtoC
MSSRPKVLVAEDDTRARDSLRALLEEEGYSVQTAADGIAASQALDEDSFEAALLDIRMPGKDGLAILREIHSRPDAPVVLVITAYGNSAAAIEAMKAGAYDYLTKPLHFDELLIQLERAIEGRRQAQQLSSYRTSDRGDGAEGLVMVGNSAAMQQVYKLIGQVAATDSTVLVRGESGTGKELVARAIHAHSPRADKRFVVRIREGCVYGGSCASPRPLRTCRRRNDLSRRDRGTRRLHSSQIASSAAGQNY